MMWQWCCGAVVDRVGCEGAVVVGTKLMVLKCLCIVLMYWWW